MTEVVVVYTLAGQIMGELVRGLNDDVIVLKNPASLIMMGANAQMTPLTVFAEGSDKTFTINKSALLFNEAYPVVKEIRDKYIEVNTGIQISPVMPVAKA